ncbi:MAG: response regulator [Bacteroidetes bacterium 4572_77]|nr:MAG: response regulator [Bacteroidetes bacterium 4572_77]
MNYTNKILIIDDSESSATYLMGLLSDCNYKVMCVHNGKDALKKARSQQFDLILLDFVMPDMNGLDVCRALKKIPSIKDVPVVFLTANHSEELLIQAFNAGAVDFVTKPYNVSELMARVKTQLSLVESLRKIYWLLLMIF